MPVTPLSNRKARKQHVPARALVAFCIIGLLNISGLFLGQSPTAYGQADSITEESLPNTAATKNADNSNRPKVFAPLSQSLQRLGDLTLRDATIQGAMFTIGETWGVNIVVGENAKGKVSGVFKQAPLREVLDSILLANGFSYRTIGNSLVVQPTQDVGTANPLLQSITIPIRHGNVMEIAEGVKMLVSEQGKVTALESARSILIIDYADRVASISRFVARMEDAAARALGGMPAETYKRLDVAYFHTQYIPAENTKEPLTAVLSKVGRVAVMPAENRLVVVDYPVNIEMVRKVLDRIDRPRPQVRITALIYDISLQDVEKLGLNWNSVGKGRNLDADGVAQQAFTFDTQTLAPFDAGTAGGTVTFKSLTRNFDLNTVGLALQTADDARLLADPNVTVMDNELAEWKSVSEIPYQQITQSELGGQIGTTAFKEAGITLRVRPRIAADGTIEMFIEPEFSRLAGFTPQENQPIIDTRRASTTVRIANRQTLVLGGLRQRSDTGQFNGIPVLKDLRLIGPAFRARDTNVRESELIVFIMPEIISFDNSPAPRQAMALETVTCKLGRIPEGEGCADSYGTCDGQFDSCGIPVDLSPLPPIEGGSISEGGILEGSESDATVGKLDGSNDGSTSEKDAVEQDEVEKSFVERMLIDQKTFRPAYQARFRATGGTDTRRQRMFESEAGPLRNELLQAELPQKVPTRKLAGREPDEKKPSLWQRMFGS